jgi:hypothetical protein
MTMQGIKIGIIIFGILVSATGNAETRQIEGVLNQYDFSRFTLNFDNQALEGVLSEFQVVNKNDKVFPLEPGPPPTIPNLVVDRFKVVSKLMAGRENYFKLAICEDCQADYDQRKISVEPRFFNALIEKFDKSEDAIPAIDFILAHEISHYIQNRIKNSLARSTNNQFQAFTGNFKNYENRDLATLTPLQTDSLNNLAIRETMDHVETDALAITALKHIGESGEASLWVLSFAYDDFKDGHHKVLSKLEAKISEVGCIYRYYSCSLLVQSESQAN